MNTCTKCNYSYSAVSALLKKYGNISQAEGSKLHSISPLPEIHIEIDSFCQEKNRQEYQIYSEVN
jgi:hypothetical protein